MSIATQTLLQAAPRRWRQLGLCLLLAVALGGCGKTTVLRPDSSPAAFPMLAPASFGRSAQFEQLLHAAHGAQDASLLCMVTITPQQITVLGLTAMGQRVFTLSYDGSELRAERSSFAPERIQPQRILADIQLALWPLAALQAATADSDWQIVEPRPGLRRLLRQQTLESEVHQGEPGRLWLVNLREAYSLDITTREISPP